MPSLCEKYVRTKHGNPGDPRLQEKEMQLWMCQGNQETEVGEKGRRRQERVRGERRRGSRDREKRERERRRKTGREEGREGKEGEAERENILSDFTQEMTERECSGNYSHNISIQWHQKTWRQMI